MATKNPLRGVAGKLGVIADAVDEVVRDLDKTFRPETVREVVTSKGERVVLETALTVALPAAQGVDMHDALAARNALLTLRGMIDRLNRLSRELAA